MDKPIRDGDIDTLSADAAQEGGDRFARKDAALRRAEARTDPTDPRTALAVLIDCYNASLPVAEVEAAALQNRLAERGVLLVTEPMLIAAMQKHQDANGRLEDHARFHCGGTCGYDLHRLLAALSAAVEGPDPYSGSANDPCACGHPLREHTLDDQDAGLCLHPGCSCDEFIEPEGAAVEGPEVTE